MICIRNGLKRKSSSTALFGAGDILIIIINYSAFAVLVRYAVLVHDDSGPVAMFVQLIVFGFVYIGGPGPVHQQFDHIAVLVVLTIISLPIEGFFDDTIGIEFPIVGHTLDFFPNLVALSIIEIQAKLGPFGLMVLLLAYIGLVSTKGLEPGLGVFRGPAIAVEPTIPIFHIISDHRFST